MTTNPRNTKDVVDEAREQRLRAEVEAEMRERVARPLHDLASTLGRARLDHQEGRPRAAGVEMAAASDACTRLRRALHHPEDHPAALTQQKNEAREVVVVLTRVLDRFESEANAADELALQGPGGECPRYGVPRRRRYEIERDTYRYVLEQLRAALSDQPSPAEPKGEE